MRVPSLRALLWGNSTAVIHECRNCGECVAEETESCPVCGWEGIARYEIE